jgi:YVTN family beta-propeller protein
MRRRTSIIAALLLTIPLLTPYALAQENESTDARHEKDTGARAQSFDRAEDEDDLNRELWEYARKSPYAEAVRYVAAAQARAQAARVSEAVLPNGWKVAPAGQQVEVGRLPYEAVNFAGRLVVLNNGYYTGEAQEISIVDTASGQVVKTLRPKRSPGTPGSLFPSAEVGADGDLYVSGGFDERVYRVNRQFEIAREYKVEGHAAGLAPVDATHVAVLYLASKDEKNNYASGRLAILNTADGKVERETEAGYFPYAVRYVGGKFYVTVVGENRLRVFDDSLKQVNDIALGRRPQAMTLDGTTLYVPATDSDEVYVVDTRRDAVTAVLHLDRFGSRFGSTPTSCAVDGERIYVTLAGLNAVAVFDKRTRRQLGLVPVGWYPTKVLADGNDLLVLSAKGMRPRRPNPNGPNPVQGGGGPDYVLTLLKGSLSIIPRPQLDANRVAWTSQVLHGSPTFDARSGFKLPIRHVFYIIKENRTYDQILGDLGRGDGDPHLTLFGRDITPNHHALSEQFVTLDNFYANGEISVLGHSFTTSGYASPFLEWLGNAAYSGRYKGYPFGIVPATTSPAYLWDSLDDARVSYRVYGENYFLYTRAYRILAETFGAQSEPVRKFYAKTMRASSENDIRIQRGGEFYTFASQYAAQGDTTQGALALLAKPEFVNALSQFLVGDESLSKEINANPALRRRFAEYLSRYAFDYRSWDLTYSDLDRFHVWHEDFERQLKAGRLPRFSYIWLPNDHTNGSDTKIRTPFQFVAQNDAALGKIVEAISHSAAWRDSLILVEEDDAQNGPDHVDATREVALAAGPFVKRGAVVHDRYDQLSALKTVELLLGLRPLNLNDRMAVPMFGLFVARPDFKPYTPTEPSALLTAEDRARYDTLSRPAPGARPSE